MFFIFEASATAVFGSIFFFGGIAQGGILVGIQGLLVSQVLFLPAVLLFTAAHGFGFAARRTTIYVRDGMLNVRYGTSGFAQHDLRKCEWFVGSLGYVNPFLVGQAVLIALPNPKNRQSAFVAVGFTDETRRIWEAFLTLAGGVRRTAWEKKVGRFRKALNIAVGVLSVPFAVGLGVLGARVARDVVFLLTADEALTELVEVMVFMVGTVFSFLYLILFWPWNPPGRAPSKRTRAEQMKIRLIVTLGTVSVILLNLVWPIFQMKKLGLQTQMTTSLIVTALALLIGMDLGKRLATFELASTDPSTPSPGDAPEQPANS
jgi:hypothetical protein